MFGWFKKKKNTGFTTNPLTIPPKLKQPEFFDTPTLQEYNKLHIDEGNMMELQDIIVKRLEKFDELVESHGGFDAEDYLKVVQPLHEALLELAKKITVQDGPTFISGPIYGADTIKPENPTCRQATAPVKFEGTAEDALYNIAKSE